MNYTSFKSIPCSIVLVSLCHLSQGMQRNYTAQQATAPVQRQISLPSPQEQRTAQLEQHITQELHQILEELGVSVQAHTPVALAALQAHAVVAKAQEFIATFNLDEMMHKLDLDQAFEQSYVPLLFHNLLMLPSHAMTVPTRQDARCMASYEQFYTSFINHLSSVMLMVDRMFQLHQNMQSGIMNELSKQKRQDDAKSQEVIERVDMLMIQGQMFVQQSCEDYLQTALPYITALWITKKLSLEDLQSCFVQQKKNLLLQISTPLIMGFKYMQLLAAGQQQSNQSSQPLQ